MDFPPPPPRPAVALLVDGENLSRELAAAVLAAAGRLGEARVRRVYGNLNAIAGWEDHGFRLCPTRPGKNAADMLLCVEAMALALRDGFATLAIASSDRDFSYLAEHLRETGTTVVGLVGAKAPASFRQACSSSVVLQPAPKPAATGPADAAASVQEQVRKIVAAAGQTGLPIASLNPALHQAGFRISQTPEKTWRAWLSARDNLFACDPAGPAARVRLRA